MDPVPTPIPTPTAPPGTPPVVTPPAHKLPFNLKAILPIVAMVAALPFLARSVFLRQLTGSRAGLPNTYCVASFGCPTPVCPKTTGCPPSPTSVLTPSATPRPNLTPSPTIMQRPDLEIQNMILNPSNPPVNGLMLIKFNLTNRGTGVAAPAQYQYTQQAGGVSSVNSANTCVNNTTLNPGQSCVSAYNFVFSTAGSKNLIINADPNNLLAESDEGNNLYSLFFTVGPFPTPSPIACQLTLTPSLLNLVSGGAAASVTATATSGLGGATLSAITFISGSGKVSLTPLSDSSAPFVTSAKAQFQLFPSAYVTTIRAMGQLSDGRPCQTSTATDTDVNVR